MLLNENNRSLKHAPVAIICIAIMSILIGCSNSETPCDGFLGEFSNQPDTAPSLRFSKKLGVYEVSIRTDQPGIWEGMELTQGFEPETEKEIAEEYPNSKPVTCVLRAEGVTFIKFSANSPLNPSESDTRNKDLYPEKTQYAMVVAVGSVAADAGLYPANPNAPEPVYDTTEHQE
ncbi:hypothetical protein N5D61_26390 [Pseudomonas sp. GD03842]|uniref:hypothetical protein n=1 Tax=Pseudomonas sp. GD03842 TaxID=2975385 RepID=UPI00244B4841|nr:hypothetical protein [Pseudomonas sp. GD03842]MDH0749859.1 hypothetical protein [Pseudomonas sp. GD03842]